jgi:hypothetical protein
VKEALGSSSRFLTIGGLNVTAGTCQSSHSSPIGWVRLTSPSRALAMSSSMANMSSVARTFEALPPLGKPPTLTSTRERHG